MREIYGDYYDRLSSKEKNWLSRKLDGPLHGAIFIDPVFLLNTVTIANDSPCMEEFMVVSIISYQSIIRLEALTSPTSLTDW